MSIGFGAVLTYTSTSTSLLPAGGQQEAFAGLVSMVAVAFVTWMIFWMRRTARHLKAQLHGRLDAALALGGVALVLTAFLAVGREGLETALFLWSAVQATGQSNAPLVGIVAGLGVAVVLGYLLYRRAVALNLAKFFTYTGAGLVVVAAGVLAYGVHDLQEGGLLHGTIGFTPDTTWLQLVAFVGYLVPVLVLFFRSPTQPPVRAGASATGAAPTRGAAPVTGPHRSRGLHRSRGRTGRPRQLTTTPRPSTLSPPRRRSLMPRVRALLVVPAGCLVATCTSAGSAVGPKVATTATDSNCEVATTSLAVDRTTFAVTNKGLKSPRFTSTRPGTGASGRTSVPVRRATSRSRWTPATMTSPASPRRPATASARRSQ